MEILKGRTSSAGLCPQGMVSGQVIEVPRLGEKVLLAAAVKPLSEQPSLLSPDVWISMVMAPGGKRA